MYFWDSRDFVLDILDCMNFSNFVELKIFVKSHSNFSVVKSRGRALKSIFSLVLAKTMIYFEFKSLVTFL